MVIRGMFDSTYREANAVRIRAAQKELFMESHSVGPLPFGFRPVEVPDTDGRPRTKPAVDSEKAKLILTAFRSVRDGMAPRQAYREFCAGAEAADPNVKVPPMSYSAFRRMLVNRCLTGEWTFGRTRNASLSDVEQAKEEIVKRRSEDLRIVDDETFGAVQKILGNGRD